MQSSAQLIQVRALADTLRKLFEMPIEIPEGSPRLALEERKGQPVRQFKHLHQMCFGHVEHLAISGKIKLLSLLDGYLACVESKTVIAHYLYARTILEQCAFTSEVKRRLDEVARKAEGNWMPKGEEFFALLIRFRFGTNDRALQAELESKGFPAKLLKPVNVGNCIASLLSTPKVAKLAESYEKLCDYVHHNGPSHFTTSSGFFMGSAAQHHASGGAIMMNQVGPISRYEYPTPTKAERAIEDTVGIVVLAATACNEMLDALRRSPFPASQIKEMTGTEHGMVFLGQTVRTSTRHH